MKTTLKLSGLRKAIMLFLILGLQIQSFAANDVDQNGKLTLSLTNVTLKTVFSNIEEKTDFSLFYENDLVDLDSIVTVEGSNLSVEKILAEVLKGQGVNFNIVNKQIVLSEKQSNALGNATKNTVEVQQSVTGTVTDASGETLPGVNITIKGQAKGTQTDFDGNYVIDANATDVLVFSYIGFKTVEKTVGSNTTINVSLVEDDTSLNEVVIIGYGKTTKSDLTGAVAKVTEEQYEDQPITRTEEILQGRTAGVSLARTGGNAGAGVKIRVRGVNSITGNNGPLVVVDGVFGGDLRTINPSDIASLEVLKDASALAVYGSRGSNGVILVTTKKGKGKPKINFERFTTISRLAKKYEGRLSQSQFANLAVENAIGGFTQDDADLLAQNPFDYEDELFRTAFSNTTQLSVSGGSDKFNYFISGNYTDQEGILETNEYQRATLRSNLNAKINDKLNVGFNIYASRENEQNDPNGFARFRGGLTSRAHTFDPLTPIRDENGNFNRVSTRGINVPVAVNPLAAILSTNTQREVDRVNTNLNVTYSFTNNLSYTLLGGLNVLNRINENFNSDIGMSASFGGNRFTEHQISNIINWTPSVGKHNFDITGVYEFQGTESRSHNYSILDPRNDNLFLADNVAVNSETNVSNGGSETAIQSYLGRVKYDFNKSLYLTASLRIDQSSRFLPGERTGYFPAVAAAYSFNNLSFIENSDVLYSLKLRGSWGEVGNQNISNTAAISTDNFADRLNFPFNGDINDVVSGSEPQRAANPFVTWETTESWNAGVDVGLFNNRVNFSFDYFEKYTKDLLTDLPNPNTGVIQALNSAEIENKGFDISLSADIIDNTNFSWSVFGTASHVENEVVSVRDGLDFFDVTRIGESTGNSRALVSLDGSGTIARVQKGQPLGAFVGRRYLGVNNSTEELLDKEGNPIAFGASVYADQLSDDVSDQEIIGNGTPTWTFGLNQTFEYKRLSLNVFLQASTGFQVYNQARAALNGGDGPFGQNLSTNALNISSVDNPTAVPFDNDFNSSRWVEDGDFLRLANLSLGYTLDNPFKGISSLNVYVSGQNLFLITDYSGYDPEGSSEGLSDRASGIDFGGIPNPRSYTMGLKLAF